MTKRILLIAPEFFNYYATLKSTLESMGYEVAYLADRPPVSSLMKVLLRKFRFLFHGLLLKFYSGQLSGLGLFDKVLIIKGESITPDILQIIRQNHCAKDITLYFWDSVKNIPGAVNLSRLADHVFTFDPHDAQKYGFTLQPLFYKEFAVSSEGSQAAVKWPVSFLGSIHGDRLKVVRDFRKKLAAPEKMYVFIYFPSRLIYYFRKLFDPAFYAFSSSELSLSSVKKTTVDDVFKSSIAVLDIQHPAQTGLTMRTIETLSLGKKLITTNDSIRSYPFYDPANILVIDRKLPAVSEDFFTSPVRRDKVELVKKYEVRQWLTDVLRLKA